MLAESHLSEWRVIGESVRGASHERIGMPNQDAIGWWPESGTGSQLVLAVSDGHGSAKSFRSEEGAHLAVGTAMRVIQSFLNGQPDLANHSAIKRTAEERLPQELVRAWRDAVEAHYTQNPFTEQERTQLEKGGPAVQKAIETKRFLAYGATLLTALVAESFIVYLQLGDGDVLTVSETGEVSRPLPKDERLFANETTSLCSSNAWSDFRICFQALFGPPPALILLSTDGYANSFRDEKNFLTVGPDLLEIIRSDGLDMVNENLKIWLNEASQVGSGDDVTLGIICRMDVIQSPIASVVAEHSREGEKQEEGKESKRGEEA